MDSGLEECPLASVPLSKQNFSSNTEGPLLSQAKDRAIWFQQFCWNEQGSGSTKINRRAGLN